MLSMKGTYLSMILQGLLVANIQKLMSMLLLSEL